jgi:predicted permease
VDVLRQDLRLALRLFGKDRGFALTVLLTLTLCIGATSAIFLVVRSVLLRPLPYPDSDRLVTSFEAYPGAGVERAEESVPNYIDRLAFTDVFESQALYQFARFQVGQGTGAEDVAAMNVTPSFFRVLHVPATRGRLFTNDEGQRGQERVAVLSSAFAERQPGGAAGIVGRELRLNDVLYTVVGVLPETFSFVNPDVTIWVPLAFTDEELSEDNRYSQNHEAIARLAPGVTPAQAQARLDAQTARNIERAGRLKPLLVNAGYHAAVVFFQADLVRRVRGAIQLLWAGVLFVLLIAAVNITNLSLVRATGRTRELAMRQALGAARGRVARQLITETTLLTLVGGVLGLVAGS